MDFFDDKSLMRLNVIESDKILTQGIQDQLMYQSIGRTLLFEFLYRRYFIVTLYLLSPSLSLPLS